jgi:hypothetical protein
LGQIIWSHIQAHGTGGAKKDDQFDFHRDVLGKETE